MGEFYDMIEKCLPNCSKCDSCGEQLWLAYADGHIWERCLDCPLKFSIDLAGYIGRYDTPLESLPDHIEARKFESNYPTHEPHERCYRLIRRRIIWRTEGF